MAKYILQHIGTSRSSKDISEKVKKYKNEINEIANGVAYKKIIAEEYIYAREFNDSDAHLRLGLHFGKNISTIEKFLTLKDRKKLLNIFPDGNLKFWGIKNGEKNIRKTQFRKIEIGDRLILIGTYGVEAVCEIGYLIEGSGVGHFLWGDYEYENNMFLKNIKAFPDIDVKELKNKLNLSLDYKRIFSIIDIEKLGGYIWLDDKIDKIFNKK